VPLIQLPPFVGYAVDVHLYFPVYLEWPWPAATPISYSTQICVLGETFTLTNYFSTYGDFGTPTWQWRKEGKLIAASVRKLRNTRFGAGRKIA
jgi:hypothetical protein